jgi:ATP-dependent Clp protease ATP-binding subunit ClpC
VFERFTDRARRVVVLAQEEARLLNHNYIGTEHVLLGLIHEGDGVAAKALESLDIMLLSVRREVEKIIGRGGQAPSGHIPFTPRAKKVLELALREAIQLGHNYIGTEHILLGLIREGEGVAAQVLVKLGADLDRVRERVIGLLAGYTEERPSEVRPLDVRAGLAAASAVSPPRFESCAVCGRDLWDVGRYVETAQFRICSDCVEAATSALERAPSQRSVTMPPRVFGEATGPG